MAASACSLGGSRGGRLAGKADSWLALDRAAAMKAFEVARNDGGTPSSVVFNLRLMGVTLLPPWRPAAGGIPCANTSSCHLSSARPAFPPQRLANAISDRSLVGHDGRQLGERSPPPELGYPVGWRFRSANLDRQPDRSQRTPVPQPIGGGGP